MAKAKANGKSNTKKSAPQKKYVQLRTRMYERGATGADLARLCMVAPTTMSAKMNGQSPWRSDEMWAIMRYLELPNSDLYKIFPPDGDDFEGIDADPVLDNLRVTHRTAVPNDSLTALRDIVDQMIRGGAL